MEERKSCAIKEFYHARCCVLMRQPSDAYRIQETQGSRSTVGWDISQRQTAWLKPSFEAGPSCREEPRFPRPFLCPLGYTPYPIVSMNAGG